MDKTNQMSQKTTTQVQTDKRGIVRYVENKYALMKTIDLEEYTKIISDNFEEVVTDHLKSYPPDIGYKLKSDGKKRDDYSLYTGSGGNTYVFWRLYLLNKGKQESAKYLEYFAKAVNKNYDLVREDDSLESSDPPPSFFQGPAGIFTMGCIYAKESNNKKSFEQSLKNLISMKNICFLKETEYELLYGVAGYLYSLLLVNKECSGVFNFNIDNDIFEIMKELYRVGKDFQKSYGTKCLVYPWPKKRVSKAKDIYLGAAHGVFGCLYMLMKSITQLTKFIEAKNEENLMKEIVAEVKSSLDYLATLRYDTGNFPSDLGNFKDDNKLHFCHGATGALLLYTAAYDFFKDDTYLSIAIKTGEDIWKRGILTKGNCVCHGISGNSYALYNLYKYTKDVEWKKRSICFIAATFDKDIQTECRLLIDPQRLVQGIPDTPYSLMEGNGGKICLVADFLNNESMVFPGFEL